MNLVIETFVVGPMPNNLYLLIDEAAREAVVIDPSMGSEEAIVRVRELQSAGIRLTAMWNTHGHFDHVFDNARWKAEFGAPLLMHPADDSFLARLQEQALWFGMEPPEVVYPDAPFEEGQIVEVGSFAARVLHTPGHSPGSVSFWFESEGVCFDGDVLFRGSVGRTDLPGCSAAQLNHSLARLCELPPATRILSGHGDPTDIGTELATNPFLQGIPA